MGFQQLLSNIRSQSKRVLVVGLGVSGIETLEFLQRAGIFAVGLERTPEPEYRMKSKWASRIDQLREGGSEIYFGIDGEKISSLLEGVCLAVVSPGISHESAVVAALRRRKIQIVAELELGVELYGCPSVVVTGSNGKSTTVSLIHHLLLGGGLQSVLCGNVGTPVVCGLDRNWEPSAPSATVLVVEASSYQLEACTVLKPKVAIHLNLSDNHLERHGSMDRYAEMKARLFWQQDAGDVALLNADDSTVRTLSSKVRSQVVLFGTQISPVGDFVRIEYDRLHGQDQIVCAIQGTQEAYDLSGCHLLGLHNRYNIAASVYAARHMGVSQKCVQEGIQSFVPLEHRLEFVNMRQAQAGGLLVINDSKATTVAAVVAALRCVTDEFSEKRIVLLIGGLAKAGSWEPLIGLLSELAPRMKPVVCFGKDANLLADHCEANSIAHVSAANLKEATQKGLQLSEPGDVLLLSPGCASFDEFSDFEERGRKFKEYFWQECNSSNRHR